MRSIHPCRYEFCIYVEEVKLSSWSRHALQFEGQDELALCTYWKDKGNGEAVFQVHTYAYGIQHCRISHTHARTLSVVLNILPLKMWHTLLFTVNYTIVYCSQLARDHTPRASAHERGRVRSLGYVGNYLKEYESASQLQSSAVASALNNDALVSFLAYSMHKLTIRCSSHATSSYATHR
jgi:hypothetical protein